MLMILWWSIISTYKRCSSGLNCLRAVTDGNSLSEPLFLWRMRKWDTVFIPVCLSKQMVQCSEWSHRFSRIVISHVNTRNHRYVAIQDKHECLVLFSFQIKAFLFKSSLLTSNSGSVHSGGVGVQCIAQDRVPFCGWWGQRAAVRLLRASCAWKKLLTIPPPSHQKEMLGEIHMGGGMEGMEVSRGDCLWWTAEMPTPLHPRPAMTSEPQSRASLGNLQKNRLTCCKRDQDWCKR